MGNSTKDNVGARGDFCKREAYQPTFDQAADIAAFARAEARAAEARAAEVEAREGFLAKVEVWAEQGAARGVPEGGAERGGGAAPLSLDTYGLKRTHSSGEVGGGEWAGLKALARQLVEPAFAHLPSVVDTVAANLRNQLTAQELRRQGYSEKAKKVAACGTEFWIPALGPGKARVGWGCGQRLLCPICARDVAQRYRRRYCQRVVQVCQETGAVPALLTLTVQDGPDLLERLEVLQGAVRGMIFSARQARAGNRHRTELSACLGGVGSVEVKRGQGSGLWHPHWHGVVLLSRWIDRDALVEEWRARSGGSYIVDIRRFAKRRSVFRSVCEVLKYAAKFGELGGSQIEAWRVCRGRRLLGSWGCLRGVIVDQDQDQGAGYDQEQGEVLKLHREENYAVFQRRGWGTWECWGIRIGKDYCDGLTGSAAPQA